jgi:hypothetical protein
MNGVGNKVGINIRIVKCPVCNERQPFIRKPKGIYEILWGGYTCNNCGCKMDKYGKKRS